MEITDITEEQFVFLMNYFSKEFENSREIREKQIPKIQLEQRHVINCKLVLNRKHLLEELPKNAVVAEIGVNEGDFSESIIEITKPRKLHLIDIWGTERFHDGLYQKVTNRFKAEIDEEKVEIHRKLSTTAVIDFEDNYFDWIYIDTDHSYETTRDELFLFSKKMKIGGIITGHDYTLGNWVSTYRYGVIEAVHEFCMKFDWEIILLTIDPLENQSFAIRKI